MMEKWFWLKASAVVLAAGSAVLWGVHFLNDPDYVVQKLYLVGRVEGASAVEVEQAVESARLGNLFLTDIEAVRAAVEDLSWVKEARVVRVWPDALRIDIERYESVAIWEDGRLVAGDGRLFSANDESIERLAQMPMFSGDAAYTAQAAAYLPAFREALSGMNARLKAVNVSFRGSWSVTTESQTMPPVTIELGRAFTEVTPVEKLKRVVRHFDHICSVMRGYPPRIDARYRDAFAVQYPSRASGQLWIKEHQSNQVKKGEG